MTSVQTSENIVYTIAEEKLHDDDYERIVPLLQEKIQTFGKVRWYFEMRDFEGWTLSAAWDDLKFDFKNLDKMERIAMVGDEKWEKYLTQLMKPFTTADMKFFSMEEADEAKNWIKRF